MDWTLGVSIFILGLGIGTVAGCWLSGGIAADEPEDNDRLSGRPDLQDEEGRYCYVPPQYPMH